MELKEAQLGGTDCGADELVDIALILGVEEQFPGFVFLMHVLLELFLILDDVFEHQFLLRCVFPIGEILSSF